MSTPSPDTEQIHVLGHVLDQVIVDAYVQGLFGPLGKPLHIHVAKNGTVWADEHEDGRALGGVVLTCCCVHPMGVVRNAGGDPVIERGKYAEAIHKAPDLYFEPVHKQLQQEAAALGYRFMVV